MVPPHATNANRKSYTINFGSQSLQNRRRQRIDCLSVEARQMRVSKRLHGVESQRTESRFESPRRNRLEILHIIQLINFDMLIIGCKSDVIIRIPI